MATKSVSFRRSRPTIADADADEIPRGPATTQASQTSSVAAGSGLQATASANAGLSSGTTHCQTLVGGPEHLPWVEKYRPHTLAEVVAQNKVVNTLSHYLSTGELPHLIFYGPPGTGKTSLALAVARVVTGPDGDPRRSVLELNASDDRQIAVVRHTIKSFCSTLRVSGSGSLKLVILDEAEAMTTEAQMALRRLMEQYSKHTRFCLIVNTIHKIVPALRSRCTRFRVGPLASLDMHTQLNRVAAHERVMLVDSGREAIVRLAHGDLRRALNLLQMCDAATRSSTVPTTTLDDRRVYETVGQPTPQEVSTVYDVLCTETMARAYLVLDDLLSNRGFSLLDLVRQLYEHLLTQLLDPQRSTWLAVTFSLPSLLSGLADCEYRLASTLGTDANESIQLASLVGVFSLAKRLRLPSSQTSSK